MDEKRFLEAVRSALLSLEGLREAEALGIFGSLARGYDFTDRSDIDIFVVVKEKKPGAETDLLWWKRIREALEEFDRDITVLVYTLKGLRNISNWYVLRLASEGTFVFDKGGIGELFKGMKEAAAISGLVREEFEGQALWRLKDLRIGEIREVKVGEESH